MAELMLLVNPHHTNSIEQSEIDADDLKLNAYLTQKGPGYISAIRPDGYFATPSNPTGKPWNGTKFWLIKIPGTVTEYKGKIKYKTVKVNTHKIEKDIPVIDENIDINSIMADATQEVWECEFPGAKESAQFRYIWTFADKNKLKIKKVVYNKTDKIVSAKSAKDAV